MATDAGVFYSTMSAEAESADADNDDSTDEGWDIYPQATQHPHTVVTGEVVRAVANFDRGAEDTGHSVGVVYRDPTVFGGTVWQNREVPDGFDSAAAFNATLRTATTDVEDYANGVEVTEEAQAEAQERIAEAVEDDVDFDSGDAYADNRLATDYKIADPDDSSYEVESVEIDGEEHVTGVSVGAKTFASEEVDEIEHDEVMVWYRGIAAQFIIQAIDFNGRPSARWKDDGYLVKGILQHPLGWFERDGENYADLLPEEIGGAGYSARSKLASKRNGLGRPPRGCRPLVLRDEVEGAELFIDIDRYDGSQMLSSTVGYNEGDWTIEEYLEAKEEAENSDETVFDLIDGLEGPRPRYEEEPEGVLVDEFDLDSEDDIEDLYDLYEGDGWQPVPGNARYGAGEGSGSGGGSFDMPDSTSDDAVEHPTPQEREFAGQLSEILAGTGMAPDDDKAFQMGDDTMNLEAVVGHNADQFSATPDVEAIRRVIYENVAHLDPDDLEDDE